MTASKPEAKSDRRSPPPAVPIFSMKGQPADMEWIERLREHIGERSVADMFRLAVVELAGRAGFAEPPPFGRATNWGGRRKPARNGAKKNPKKSPQGD